MEITTRAPKTDRELVVEYDFGSSLQDAISKFGEAVVFSNFQDSAVISLQANVRRMLEMKEDKRLSDDEIKAKVAAWKIGVKAVRTSDSKEKLLEKFNKLSAEGKAELIAAIKASMQAG